MLLILYLLIFHWLINQWKWKVFAFCFCFLDWSQSEIIILPEDLELSKQMNELGLPLSFQANNEVLIVILIQIKLFSWYYDLVYVWIGALSFTELRCGNVVLANTTFWNFNKIMMSLWFRLIHSDSKHALHILAPIGLLWAH